MAVKILHKRSAVQFKNATAAQLEDGELGINYHESGPYLQCRNTAGEIINLGGVYFTDDTGSAPSNPLEGRFWLQGDTLKLYDGTQWITIASGGDDTSGGNGQQALVIGGDGIIIDDEDDGIRQRTITVTADVDEDRGLAFEDEHIYVKLGIGLDFDPTGAIEAKVADGIIIDSNGNIIIDPNFNLDGNITEPGDGNIVINGGDGISASGENATANQSVDTARTLSVDTNWLGTWIDTNRPAPNVGDGEITIKDSDGNPVGTFNVNQASDQDILLPEVVIPESLHPKGFINVEDPAPANPEHGDIYIQHKVDLSDGISDASFAPGIPTGTAVEEGTFVMYGVDDLWHAGGNANSTQVQSDWTETNNTEPSFIQNKPDIVPFPEAPNNTNVYCRNGASEQWVQGIPYNFSVLEELI